MNQELNNLDSAVEDKDWQPDSWQAREAKQQANYADQGELQSALDELSGLPPLLTSFSFPNSLLNLLNISSCFFVTILLLFS